jgi:hypothetical protein
LAAFGRHLRLEGHHAGGEGAPVEWHLELRAVRGEGGSRIEDLERQLEHGVGAIELPSLERYHLLLPVKCFGSAPSRLTQMPAAISPCREEVS